MLTGCFCSNIIFNLSNIPTNTQVYFTLKQRQNDRFHVVSMWNTHGVFVRVILSSNEIKILKKGLDLAPIQMKINEPELRSDFGERCHEPSALLVMNLHYILTKNLYFILVVLECS